DVTKVVSEPLRTHGGPRHRPRHEPVDRREFPGEVVEQLSPARRYRVMGLLQKIFERPARPPRRAQVSSETVKPEIVKTEDEWKAELDPEGYPVRGGKGPRPAWPG